MTEFGEDPLADAAALIARGRACGEEDIAMASAYALIGIGLELRKIAATLAQIRWEQKYTQPVRPG